MIIPVSGVIPTINRKEILQRTLLSISKQNLQPAEIIIIDASDEVKVSDVLKENFPELKSEIKWIKAEEKGAAKQRNQGVALARYDFILFMDDDIVLEENCIEKLWNAINSDPKIGGANAMITNQKYTPPGFISRTFFRILNGKKLNSYAGKVIGPAFNLLPEDNPALPEIVKVEWMNLGCTLYRKSALPAPPFPDYFEGYSLMEDLTLSLTVGKKWKLVNARTARIFHDSQAGKHKSDIVEMTRMSLLNRYIIIKKVMQKTKGHLILKLFLLQVFNLLTAFLIKGKFFDTLKFIKGNLLGYFEIIKNKNA